MFTHPPDRRRLMDEFLPVETGMCRRGNLLRNGLKCRLDSPPPPDFNVDWQNIFRAEPSAQCNYFNIEIGGAGGCTKMASASGSCGREAFELAKFRPSAVSGEGRCALSQSTISMIKATHRTAMKTKTTKTANKTMPTNTTKTTTNPNTNTNTTNTNTTNTNTNTNTTKTKTNAVRVSFGDNAGICGGIADVFAVRCGAERLSGGPRRAEPP